MVALSEVCDIVIGRTPPRASSQYWGGNHPWLSIADMGKARAISATKESISDEGARLFGNRQARPGTVLLSFKLSVGKVGIAEIPLYTNEAIAALPIRDPSRLLPEYLAHYLEFTDLTAGTDRAAMGNTLNLPKLRAIDVPLPPLPEQRRIASILDEASDLRAIRARSLEHLSRLVDSDFEARFGNVLSEDRGWRIGHVGDLVTSFSSGRSIVGVEGVEASKYRVLKISAVTKGSFAPTETKALPPGYEPPEQHLVRQGDLLISRANTRELVGATAMVREPVSNLALPDKLWRFNWREGEGSPSSYVWRAFSRPEFRKALSDIATGSGGSMKNISQSAVLGMRLAIPPRNIRDEYQGVLEEFDSLRRRAEIDLAMLDELFASLQHRAFRGEL